MKKIYLKLFLFFCLRALWEIFHHIYSHSKIFVCMCFYCSRLSVLVWSDLMFLLSLYIIYDVTFDFSCIWFSSHIYTKSLYVLRVNFSVPNIRRQNVMGWLQNVAEWSARRNGRGSSRSKTTWRRGSVTHVLL